MIIGDDRRRSMGSGPSMSHSAEDGSMKDGPAEDGMQMFNALASEIMDAIDNKDHEALAESLHAFYQECSMMHDDDDKDEEDYG